VYQRDIYVRADFDHDLDWHQLEGDHDVFDDGRLIVLSTPGHTRGHQSLMVRLDSGQTVILLADAAYLLAKMRQRAIPGVVWSPDAMVSSWERIEALEREHAAMLIATHDLDFRERLELAPDSWYE
jgi:glyoxylase-like metal-dependent hydrolase (beta-lactamase superfamily II)